MEPTPQGPKTPPWRAKHPTLYRRREGVDQFEETQAKIQKALNRAYQGELLSDQQIEQLAQIVLLDLLSSLDPLARAIAAREVIELRRNTAIGARERALRAARKRDEYETPRTEHAAAAKGLLAELESVSRDAQQPRS